VKNGEIKKLAGISSPYKEPESPEMIGDKYVRAGGSSVTTLLVYGRRKRE